MNSKLTDEMKEGYDSGVPFWDAAETTGESLKVGSFVEVTIPFYWCSDEHYEIGTRFVIKKEHIGPDFEK